MIPHAVITEWGAARPWPNRQAIEQDLLLARMIVEIYNHPFLSQELVFRGGTCLHQVVLPAPLRYSEDLDFVRRTHGGIGEVLTPSGMWPTLSAFAYKVPIAAQPSRRCA